MNKSDQTRGRQRGAARRRPDGQPSADHEIFIGRSAVARKREPKGTGSLLTHFKRPDFHSLLSGLRSLPGRLNDRRTLMVLAVFVVAVGLVVGGGFGIRALVVANRQRQLEAQPTETAPAYVPEVSLPPRATAAAEPEVTAQPGQPRDLSHGAQDISFSLDRTNQPGIYDKELVFSAGTGSADGEVFTSFYLYNLDTGQEEEIAKTGLYKGEIFETLVNHDWIVWLDTDKGKNNIIYVLNRNTNVKTKIKNCTNGKPKLRLYGDTLIWMEQASKTVDYLRMYDLTTQEDLTLFSFQDVATYGVSAPCIYEDWVVWAGPEEEQDQTVDTGTDTATAAPTVTADASATAAPEDTPETSAIYYMQLGVDFASDGPKPRIYKPGTYVHEPLFNGEVFVWLDGNKAPGSNLYLAEPDGEPRIIATGVTTYSLGDGFVVYGYDEGVWVYIYDKDETCRLTQEGERGMLPMVTGRTVVWYNLSSGKEGDVLRYIILTDEELYPEGDTDGQE